MALPLESEVEETDMMAIHVLKSAHKEIDHSWLDLVPGEPASNRPPLLEYNKRSEDNVADFLNELTDNAKIQK